MKRRNLRKGMAMAMATAMAFTTAFGTAPLQVAKAADSVPDIGTVDWDNGTLTVNVESDLDGIYVANSSVGSTLKVPASTKYEWIENDGVGDLDDNNPNTIEIDMSWLPSSNQYVFIATDTDDIDAVAKAKASAPATDAQKAKIKVLKVDKAPTLAASYVGTIDSSKKFKKVSIATDSAIELSEGYFMLAMKPATGSAFQALTKDEVKKNVWGGDKVDESNKMETEGYAVKGKTFYFDYTPGNAAVHEKTLTNAASSEILTVGRSSKAISVKLPAKKGAPSAAKADYKKDTVKLPSKSEYKVKVGTSGESEWIKVEGTKTVEKKIAELAPNAEEVGATIKVRTAATATAPSSKVKVIKVKPETTTTGASIQGTTDVLVTSKGAFGISFKTAYDAKSGIVLTNYTSDKYDYALVSKADLKGDISTGSLKKDANVDWSKISWKQVAAPSASAAAGKTATISKSTYVDRDGKLKKDDYVILYRNVGDGKYTQRAQIKAVELKNVKTLVQKMTLTPAGKTAVEITSGAAVEIQKYTALTTGGAIGTIKIDKPITIKKASDKYSITTGVYGEKQCTNSKVGLNLKVTKTHDGVELAVDDSARKKSTAGTYYVKIIIEGSVGVIEVEVK